MRYDFAKKAAAALATVLLSIPVVAFAQTSVTPPAPVEMQAAAPAASPPSAGVGPAQAPVTTPATALTSEARPSIARTAIAAPASEPPVAPARSPAPAAQGDINSDYILGSADKIRLTVYGEPSITGEYFVSSSGTVSLPLAGDVQATGLTLRDFRDRVVKVLQDGYLKDPKVSLEVLTFRPFYILGEVTKPGQYPYTSGLTVFNAVATAGGFTYRANTRKVLIKRATETAEHEIVLNAETTISPGDTVRVMERFF